MDDNSWYTYVAVGLSLALIVGVAIGLGTEGEVAPPPSSNTQGVVDYLPITIAWTPAGGNDSYFPANFSIPAHTLVKFTITSYDNGSNPVVPAFLGVQGTVGGTETLTSDGTTQTVHSLPSTGVAHTFTVLPAGSSSGAASGRSAPILNAVIPPATSIASPVMVEFAAYFNATGTFSWQCMAPCDSGAMATMGMMAGVVTVV